MLTIGPARRMCRPHSASCMRGGTKRNAFGTKYRSTNAADCSGHQNAELEYQARVGRRGWPRPEQSAEKGAVRGGIPPPWGWHRRSASWIGAARRSNGSRKASTRSNGRASPARGSATTKCVFSCTPWRRGDRHSDCRIGTGVAFDRHICYATRDRKWSSGESRLREEART